MKEWWMAQLCCCLYSFTFICISTRHRSQDSFFTFQCSSSLDPARARTNQTSTLLFASRNRERSTSLLTPLGPACDGRCSSPLAHLLSSVAGWFGDLIPAGGHLKCTGSHHYALWGMLNVSYPSGYPLPAPRNGSLIFYILPAVSTGFGTIKITSSPSP